MTHDESVLGAQQLRLKPLQLANGGPAIVSSDAATCLLAQGTVVQGKPACRETKVEQARLRHMLAIWIAHSSSAMVALC